MMWESSGPFFVMIKACGGLFLFTGSGFFRGFERIDLGFDVLNFDFLMGGEVAEAAFPLQRRGRSNRTDRADGPLDDTLASLTVV